MSALEDEGLASSHDHRRQSLSSSKKRVKSSPLSSTAVTSSSSYTPPLPLPSPIPPTCVTLMTLVKDERYHMILSQMILDVLQSFLPLSRNTLSQQEQQRYRFRAEAQLLASLFHMYYSIQPSFFLQKRNNTMIPEPPPIQTMAMKFMDLIFVVGDTMADQKSTQPKNEHHVWKERRTITQFLLAQIVWRYIILKVKEMDTLSASTTENENSSSVIAATLRFLERIFCKKSNHKQDRHDYDEDKDQRMMVKSGHPAKANTEQPYSSATVPVCSSSNIEHLSGLKRRQVFEEQRRRLMERAEATSKPKKEEKGANKVVNKSTNTSNKSTKHSSNKRVFLWLYKMLYPVERWTISILKQVASTYSMGSSFLDSFASGSHLTGSLSREDESVENDTGTRNVNATTRNSPSSVWSLYLTRRLFKCIQRLHLALFIVEGKYPTMLHRLFRIQYRHQPISQQQQANVTPTFASYNLVSLLILLQCVSEFGQITGSTTLVVWRTLLTRAKKWKYDFWMKTTNIISTSTTTIINKSVDVFVDGDGAPSKEKSFLEQLEELVPSMASVVNPNEAIYGADGCYLSSSSGNDNNNKNSNRDAVALPLVVTKTTTTTTTATASPTIICAVCRQSRRCPSGVSPLCGHVFCWECILSWTSNHKPECPFCRTPCPPQTVLALYNY